MALLVGQNDSSTYTTGRQLAVNNRCLYTPYTAVATGTATAIYWYVQGGTASATFRLALWTSTGTLITNTAEMTISGSDVWVSGSITASITSGTEYLIGVMANGSAGNGYPDSPYYYSATTGSESKVNDSGTYPTVPNVVPGSDSSIGVGALPFYVDGTVGGGTSIPVILNHLLRH